MYDQIISDLRNGKITSAENVLKWGVYAFSIKIKEINLKSSFISTYFKILNDSKKTILSTKKNQPSLFSALNYIFDKSRYIHFKDLDEIKEDVLERLNTIEDRVKFVNYKISQIASKKIKNGMKVFTFGHSSFVEEILEESLKSSKFILNYSEVGIPIKSYVQRLSKLLKVNYYPFFMIDSAISNSDIILIGTNGCNVDGFLCQSGVSAILDIAQMKGIPVYVVSDLLKFSKDFKFDLNIDCDFSIVLPKNIDLISKKYEFISFDLFDGIISEIGITNWRDYKHEAETNLK